MKTQNQSSRALFDTRRDTVKLKHFAHFVRGKTKVAVPPSSPQLTALKLREKLQSLIQIFFTGERHFKIVFTRDISTLP